MYHACSFGSGYINQDIFCEIHVLVFMNQRPQNKTRHVSLTEQKVGNILDVLGKGDKFFNRTSMAQALRSKLTHRTS